jgi:hypothetical protein
MTAEERFWVLIGQTIGDHMQVSVINGLPTHHHTACRHRQRGMRGDSGRVERFTCTHKTFSYLLIMNAMTSKTQRMYTNSSPFTYRSLEPKTLVSVLDERGNRCHIYPPSHSGVYRP